MEVNELVERNVRRQVEVLRSTPPTLSERVGDGRLAIVGAVYELATGQVHFLDA
jgi:carbonic anhydrase/SulP family sulfate permease